MTAPRTASGDDDESGGGGSGKRTDSPKTPTVGPYHVMAVAIISLAVVAVTLVVLGEVENEADSATGVLGVIVPVFATVGAAVFGVTAAYNVGKTSGEDKGAAQGAAAGEARAKRDIAATLLKDLRAADAELETLRRTLRTAGASEPQQDTVRFAEPATIEGAELDAGQAAVQRAIGACEALTAR